MKDLNLFKLKLRINELNFVQSKTLLLQYKMNLNLKDHV